MVTVCCAIAALAAGVLRTLFGWAGFQGALRPVGLKRDLSISEPIVGAVQVLLTDRWCSIYLQKKLSEFFRRKQHRGRLDF
jgi:hypothetical protein